MVGANKDKPSFSECLEHTRRHIQGDSVGELRINSMLSNLGVSACCYLLTCWCEDPYRVNLYLKNFPIGVDARYLDVVRKLITRLECLTKGEMTGNTAVDWIRRQKW